MINFINTNVYSYVTECTTYADGLNKLECAYVKPVNEIYSRDCLNTSRQNEGESLEDFLQRLKILRNDCNFGDVTASRCKEPAIRDAFITGLGSPYIRQRLHEDNELRLNHVFNKARSLHEAQKNAESYEVRHAKRIATVSFDNTKIGQPQKENEKRRSGSASFKCRSCKFCGSLWHKRPNCQANQRLYYKCNRMGHFTRVCLSKVKKIPKTLATVCEDEEEHSYISALNNLIGDEKANVIMLVNGIRANCLIDTGAKFNHIDSKFCQQVKLNYEENSDILKLELAVKNSAVKTKRLCSTSVGFQGRDYNNVKFLVLENLLWDVILGCEFLSQHKSVKVDFGGPESSLKLGALSILRGIKPVRLFEYLNPNNRPITTKRRCY